MKTIFCDIDGTLLSHSGDLENLYTNTPIVLPSVHKRIQEWHMKGYKLILVTARPESLRTITINQLQIAKISYDMLIMGVPRGPRVVINDMKPNSDEYMAISYNIDRNAGLTYVYI